MKPGDKILIPHTLDDPTTIAEYVVEKVGRDTVTCDPEQVFYTAFVWPEAAKAELVRILTIRRDLKRAYDDSMGMVYELRNKITRGEIK